MKLKIVNKRKFVRSLIIVMISISLFLLIGFTDTYSKGELKYREEYVYNGDTLWSIAEREMKENLYYKNKDIRYIVRQLKDLNQIESSSLKIGQKIRIPTI